MNELIHVGSRTHLDVSEIVMLEAEINYTRLYLKNGEEFLVSYHLGKLAERLAAHDSSVRPNRNTVVNLSFLTQYSSDKITINQKSVPISRRKRIESPLPNAKNIYQTNNL